MVNSVQNFKLLALKLVRRRIVEFWNSASIAMLDLYLWVYNSCTIASIGSQFNSSVDYDPSYLCSDGNFEITIRCRVRVRIAGLSDHEVTSSFTTILIWFFLQYVLLTSTHVWYAVWGVLRVGIRCRVQVRIAGLSDHEVTSSFATILIRFFLQYVLLTSAHLRHAVWGIFKVRIRCWVRVRIAGLSDHENLS